MITYNFIKVHRKKWDLSQAELGYLLGYDGNSTVSRIEAGKQPPSREELLLLELLFEKPSSGLFPDIHEELIGRLLDRLGYIEENLCELPEDQESLIKLNRVRALRKKLCAASTSRT